MSLLLSLPSEIILLIFDYITPKYLQDHPEIQYISKNWHTYAEITALRSLHLVPIHLPNFPPKNSRIRELVQSYTTSVSLKLIKFPDLNISLLSEDASDYELLFPDLKPLKLHLSHFASSITTLKTLKNFSLVACCEFISHPLSRNRQPLLGGDTTNTPPEPVEEVRRDEPYNYLYDKSVYTIISSLPAQKLTSLALDTIGSKQPRRSKPSQWHFCAMFKDFTALRVLKVRMPYICEEVFLVGDEENSRIEEIDINVGRRDQAGRWSPNRCMSCRGRASGQRLLEVLVDAGKEAMVRCKRLKRCVVLVDQYRHVQSRWDLIAVDCDTGHKIVCWNDESSKGVMGATLGSEYDGWDLSKTWDKKLEMFL